VTAHWWQKRPRNVRPLNRAALDDYMAIGRMAAPDDGPANLAAAEDRPVMPGYYRTDPRDRMAEELIEFRSRLGRVEAAVRDLADAFAVHLHHGKGDA
jgi:hypothetical protein